MKKLCTTLLVLCLFFSLQAGGVEERGGSAEAAADVPVLQELTWARAYESTSIDPAEATDDNSTNIVSYITEGLTRIVDGQIEPGIAESWDISDDGMVYTFHLRESVWSDGTPLDANDFVYSFFRLIAPEQGHAQGSTGYVVANAQAFAEGAAEKETVGYKALDDSTVEITFQNTGVENLFILAQTYFRPVKQSLADEVGSAYGSEKDAVIGNGPFVITEWSHENTMVLEKNALYWNVDAITLDKLTGLANVANDTAVEMMQTGMVDLATFNDPLHYGQLQDEGFLSTSYSNSYQFLHINHKGKSEEAGRFLTNNNFRLALSYALDRAALCSSVLQGQQPADRLADPAMMGVEDLFVKEYPLSDGLNTTADKDKAMEYLNLALEELDATVEDVPELYMLCYESQGSQTALQACQDMFLTNLGITCVIDPQPIQQMIGKVFSYDYDFWYGGLGSGTVDIASNDGILGYWDGSSPSALFGYNNADYTEYLETAQQTLDLKERKDAIAAMEEIFCREIPDLLITWQTVHAMYRDGIELHGISNAFGPDLAFAEVIKNK